MAGLKLNFANVAETSFATIVAGEYTAILTGAELKPVKSPGPDAPKDAQMVNWEFTIQATGNETHDKFASRKVWTNTTLYGGGLGRLKNLLKSLGEVVDADYDLNPQKLVGTPVKIKVRVRPAQGEYPERNDISGWESIDGAKSGGSASKSMLP
jgi:hypothetical protein